MTVVFFSPLLNKDNLNTAFVISYVFDTLEVEVKIKIFQSKLC
jgi:hypothetical protein